jgi:hypothetical protein
MRKKIDPDTLQMLDETNSKWVKQWTSRVEPAYDPNL